MGCVVPEMPSNMVEIFLTKYHACRQAKAKSFGRRRTFIDSQFLMPGSFGLFQLTFQPDNLRRVTSGFTIQTDGANYQCPPPWDAGSIVTVQFTGTGAAVDAGPG